MSDYYIYKYDESFDFFEGELPQHLNMYFIFGDQLIRARKLLTHRSREEINFIIESLDWMLRQSGRLETEQSFIRRETEDIIFINRVKALKLYSESFEITQQELLPDATWTDYFAVLSLVTILEALNPNNLIEKTFLDHELPMEALEAVCLAEFYKELAETTTNEFKKRGQAGGQKRASKFGDLMKKVLTKYDETPRYQNTSNRQAARYLMDDFHEEIAETLSGSEPRETLERWIGKHKKRS